MWLHAYDGKGSRWRGWPISADGGAADAAAAPMSTVTTSAVIETARSPPDIGGLGGRACGKLG